MEHQLQRPLQIAVFGSDADHCSEEAKKLAHTAGKEIARQGAILLTGGGEGVMKYASQGAHEEGGTVVGILPGADKRVANSYCTIVIPTEIGFARRQVLANAADAAIVIEGGFGTRDEVGETYWRLIPTIALPESGGTARDVADTYLDRRSLVKIYSAKTPQDAVTEAIRLACNRLDLQKRLANVGLDLTIYRTVPPKFIRINPRDPIDMPDLEKRLQTDYGIGVEFTEPETPRIKNVYQSSNPHIGGLINGKENGLFMRHYFIQDLASVLTVDALNLKKGESFLDLCASPGFKTILAYDLVRGKLNITAVDNHPGRFEKLKGFLAQYGIPASLHLTDGTTFCGETYDKVLVDAPCSGEGMVVKYDDTLQREVGGINKVLEVSSEDVERLTKVQRALLENGFKHLKVGGRLVYTTCALNTLENESVIAEFLVDNRTAYFDRHALYQCRYFPAHQIFNFDGGADFFTFGGRIVPGKTRGLYFTIISKRE